MTKVIKCGIRYYNSNLEALSQEDRIITGIVSENISKIERNNNYEEKLKVWHELNLNALTQYWIGDFSKISQSFGRYNYPEPKYFISVHPTTFEEVIKFNIYNIRVAIEEIGNFDTYKRGYFQIIEGQDRNPLVRMKIRNDLNNLKSEIPSSSFLKSGIQHWYESFRDSQDTLNETDYSVFVDESIKHMSKNGMSYGSPPFLRYLLDEPKYILEAAHGYLLTRKIPFLQELSSKYDPTLISKNISETLVSVSETDELQLEQEDKKNSKKKARQLTTKQQLILLHKIGYPPILSKLATLHQASILAQLLFRNEQEIRSMLTYWDNVNAPKKYDCTSQDDIEKVIDFLEDNNLLI